jgi:hypothetical protein
MLGNRSRSLAATSLLFGATAWAQTAQLDAPRPTKTKDAAPSFAKNFGPDHTRMYYQDADDGTWASGATYKARFGSDAVDFVPRFGPSAPRNMPLALDLAGVTVDGVQLSFAGDVQPSRTGDAIEFTRGSVTERYDLTPGAVEQSFVIASLPIRGEIAVHVAFDGEYTASTDADGRTVVFANPLGTVECRDAVAIDARGERVDLSMAVEGSSYVIVVPADFVQSAAFPLVVDPSLFPFAIDDTSDDDYLADVAYDVASNSWRAVYEETVSATDIDVYSFAFDWNGIGVTNSGGYIDSTSERWAHARIANNRWSAMFAIVAECGPIGSRWIKTRHVSALSQSFSATWTLATNVNGEVYNPDIGGDPSVWGPAPFLAVHERRFGSNDHDIHGHLLDHNGVPVGSVFYIDNSGGTVDEVPAISSSNGMPPLNEQSWTIVWQRLAQPGNHDVYGARVKSNGTVQNYAFPIAATLQDETNPSVSSPLDTGGAARRSLMACEIATSATDHDIQLALFSGTTVHAALDLSVAEGWEVLDQIEPHVDTDGTQFVVTYGEEFYGADYDIFAAFVGPIGDALSPTKPRELLAWTGDPEHNPCVVAAHSSSANSASYLAAWDQHNGVDRDVLGYFLDGPPGGEIYGFCYSPAIQCPCGNSGASGRGCANSVNPLGAQLSVSGVASVAHDTLAFQAVGMPATASCLFFEGTTQISYGTGIPFGDGRKCVGGTIVRFPLKGCVNGATSYPQAGDAKISVVGFVPAIGGTRYYQAWYRDPASFCTSGNYNLSNAIAVEWLP